MALGTPRTWTHGETWRESYLQALSAQMLELAPAKVTTAGDLVQGTGVGSIARLAIGTEGQVLTMVSGSVAWFG